MKPAAILVMQGKAPPDALRHAGWEYDRSLPGWRAPVGSEAATIGFEAAVLAKDDAVLGDLLMSEEFDRDAVARIDAARTAALEDRDCSKIVSWDAAEAAAAGDAYMSALKQAWGTDSEEAVEEALMVLIRPVVPRSEWVDSSDLSALADEHGDGTGTHRRFGLRRQRRPCSGRPLGIHAVRGAHHRELDTP